MPEGTALYVRHITQKDHGTPQAFAKKCARGGLGWIALAGLWQDEKDGKPTSKWINKVDVIHKYGTALEAEDIEVYVWGYPWQGREEAFAEKMLAAAAPFGRILLDPELGSNPTRSTRGAGKVNANAHAEKLVRLFAEHGHGELDVLGLSTFGSGWRMGWFPMLAFTNALIDHFGGRSFIGGQTYTVGEELVDRSIADMQEVIEKAGGVVVQLDSHTEPRGVEVVPNFGTYARDKIPGSKRTKVRSKTAMELRSHLYGFIDDGEPIDALIGWAENFMNDSLWEELERFSKLMERGACRL